MSANPESPLQTTYEGRGFGGGHPVLDQYLAQADKLVAATKSGGVTMPSTTRDIAEGADPLPVGEKEWYGVGGASDYRARGEYATARDRPRVPEKVYANNPSLSGRQFDQNAGLEYVLDVESHNVARAKTGIRTEAAFAGGWTEDGGDKVVLDHSLALRNKNTAMRMARSVGERAIFDAKNIRDIPVTP